MSNRGSWVRGDLWNVGESRLATGSQAGLASYGAGAIAFVLYIISFADTAE